MTFHPEPNPNWLTAEYWGMDIGGLSSLEQNQAAVMGFATEAEGNFAAEQLKDYLASALVGDYAEMSGIRAGAYDPTPQQVADGAVLIVASESLTQWTGGPDWIPYNEDDTAPIPRPPYTQYWLQQQGSGGTFGIEVANFWDEKAAYCTMVEWGVLVTQADGSRGVVCHSFCEPKTDQDGNVELQGSRNVGFRGLLELPLEIGSTNSVMNVQMHTSTLRSIFRVNEIHSVYGFASQREQQPSLLEQFQDSIRRLREIGAEPTWLPGVVPPLNS